MSALLAVGVLAAAMFTVYQIERRQVAQTLRRRAARRSVWRRAGERKEGVRP